MPVDRARINEKRGEAPAVGIRATQVPSLDLWEHGLCRRLVCRTCRRRVSVLELQTIRQPLRLVCRACLEMSHER